MSMRPIWVVSLVAAAALVLVLARQAVAYEEMYRPTPIGEVEVRELPARLALAAVAEGSYFDRDDDMFMTLFRYIQRHDIAMTVPVEAEIDDAEMRFFVGADRPGGATPSDDEVTALSMPPRQVLSVGLRGAYSAATYERGLGILREWLAEHPEYEEAAPPYAVYWNGPYVPSFMRRSEVHIPIAPARP